MKAIRISQYGGPDVLTLEEIARPEPSEGVLRIKIEAAGLNFIDTYHRTGLYPLNLPLTLGMEGAGTVDAVGKNTAGFRIGDRVAWKSVPGSYADFVLAKPSDVVRIPDQVETRTAAAAMLQGLTAHYLSHSTYPLGEQ
ncbi:MAG: alcohol dehydrogenase catalytic domain-containing protein, partial [bacterium]|nr:alcohol dehydrogenase catalytic domain-containing protein [bacterium]